MRAHSRVLTCSLLHAERKRTCTCAEPRWAVSRRRDAIFCSVKHYNGEQGENMCAGTKLARARLPNYCAQSKDSSLARMP